MASIVFSKFVAPVSASPASIAAGSAVAVGDVIALEIGLNGTTTADVTSVGPDQLGNTYTRVNSDADTTVTSNRQTSYVCVVTTAGVPTIPIAFSGGATLEVPIALVVGRGCNTSSPVRANLLRAGAYIGGGAGHADTNIVTAQVGDITLVGVRESFGTALGAGNGASFATGSTTSYNAALVKQVTATGDEYGSITFTSDVQPHIHGLVLATAAGGAAPNAPTTLSRTIAPGQVTLNWTDASSDETGFKVFRSVNGGAFAQLSPTLSANVVSVIDTTVAVGNAYAYYVKSTNASGDSAASNTVTADFTGTSGSSSGSPTITNGGPARRAP